MPMLIYRPSHADRTEFVEFWRCVYGDDKTEKLYSENIRRELTEQSILQLFEWKNTTRLSKRKEASVRRNFIEPLQAGRLENIQPDQSREDLLAHFPEGGVIFRIFWLHCLQPDRFPIYDQHVHRAMAYLLKWPQVDIPDYDPTKVNIYIEKYLPFTEMFDGCDRRKTDRALWTFGRFLSLGYAKALTT